MEGFKRHGLFQDEGGSDKGINTTAPHKRVEDLYDSYRQTALRFCKGDMQKADYFLDTSVYEYFYRIVQENKYIEWHNENMKPKTTGKSERENQ